MTLFHLILHTYSIIILKTDIIPYHVPKSNQYNSTITAIKSQEVRRLMYR